MTDEVVAEFIARIERIAFRVEDVGTHITLARDPKNEPYLNLAAHVQANYRVSRDRDLLEGKDAIVQTMRYLRIVDPVTFLIEVRSLIRSSRRAKLVYALISTSCFVAIPTGRSIGMPAQASSVVKRSP